MATITATKEKAMTRKQAHTRNMIVQNLAIHALRNDDEATVGATYSILCDRHGIDQMIEAEFPTIDTYRDAVQQVIDNMDTLTAA
jgi:hypothetical protein